MMGVRVIVLETSALIAILNDEEDASQYAKAISEATGLLVSSATMVEAGIVMLRRHGPKGASKVIALLQEAGFGSKA
jgi:ribonuclease VapC